MATIEGDGSDNSLRGTDEPDLMYGLGGNDKLRGGGGADVMFGGMGNDRYWVGSFSDATGYDAVIEQAGEGWDTVVASVSYMLPENVERLNLTGTADLVGTGNGEGNRIDGNAGANVLNGAGGDDTVKGKGGEDTLYGGDGNDLLVANGGDTLYGGSGDDAYVVSGPGDDILEYDGEGYDVVRSRGDFAQFGSIERLVLLGTAQLQAGVAEGLDGYIVGNAGDNEIYGDDGDDRLFGRDGDDLILGDRPGGPYTFVTASNDTLVAGAGRDILEGGGGNDRLKTGVADGDPDYLSGGIGNDRYVIHEGEFDQVVEYAGQGFDTVVVLGPLFQNGGHVERVILKGGEDSTVIGWAHDEIILGDTYADEIWGAGGDDTIKGSAGDDTIHGDFWTDPAGPVPEEYGDAGNDLLRGGGGDDLLIGGLGNDTLVGEAGRDLLVGGHSDGHLPEDPSDPNFSAGADRYVVDPDGGFVDVYIEDFSLSDGDRIILEGIDADPSTPEDDAFAFWDGPPPETGGWIWIDDTPSGPRIRGTFADGSDAGFAIGLYTPGYEITDLTEAHFAL